jgi:peptidoglycan/LPS O-acetylase OafA/YrhL
LYFLYFVLSWLAGFNFSIYENILTLFLINNTGLSLQPGNISGAWFISVLTFVTLFYFCLLKYLRRELATLIIGVITFISFVFLVNITHGSLGGHIRIYGCFINAGMLRGFSCIGLGYLIGSLYLYIKPILSPVASSSKETAIYTLLEISLLSFLLINLIFKRFVFQNKLILVIAFAGLLWLFLLNKGGVSRFASNSKFSEIGKYTFSIYLTHLFIFKAFSYTLWKSNLPPLAILVLTLSSILVFAVLFFRYIEKPCYSYLQEKLRNIEAKRQLSITTNFNPK